MEYWNLVFDGVLILTACIIIGLCTHNGFVKSILCFGKTILSLIVAGIFGQVVAKWFSSGIVGTKIHESIFQMFSGMYSAGTESFDLTLALEKTPESIRSILIHLNVDMEQLAQLASRTEATSEQLREFSLAVSTPIVGFVCSALGFICVFFLTLIVVQILICISDFFTSLPVIHFCNQTLGFLLGIALAVLVTVLLSRVGAAILAAITSVDPSSTFAGAYEKTYLMRHLNQLFGYGL